MSPPDAGTRRSAALVFVLAFAYFLLFVGYGFQVEDEGTLYFWLDRVARGDLPYVDFHTGYTPGYYYVTLALRTVFGAAAALVQSTGGSAATAATGAGAALAAATAAAATTAAATAATATAAAATGSEAVGDAGVLGLRIAMALVNAAAAALLYALARKCRVGPWLAAVAPVLWLAFIPVYPGEFAAFNIPYPAWLATLAWLVCASAALTFVDAGTLRSLALAGFAAAVAFAVKPNAGAFALAAATWVVVASTRAPHGADTVFGWIAALAMALGVWFAFGLRTHGVDAVVHLAPLAAIVVLVCGPLRARYGGARHPATSRALLALATAFVVPTLAWVAPLAWRLGIDGFARDVLLIGSDAALLYYRPYPLPEPYALGMLAALVAAAIGGALVRSWRASPLALIGIAVLVVAAAGATIARYGIMPESVWTSLSLQMENAWFWLAPLIDAAGIVVLWVAARRLRPLRDEPRLAVFVLFAVAMFWQLFPRTDFMHVVIAFPLTLVLGTWFLERIVVWWQQGAWPDWIAPRAVVHSGVALVVLAVAAVETAPALVSTVGCAAGRGVAIRSARLQVCTDAGTEDELQMLVRAGDYLDAHTEAGEPVLAFPGVTALLFLSRTTNPVEHDYWFPGRPSRHDELRMLEVVRADPPRLVATINDGWWYFLDAPEYFLDIREFVVSNYRLVARFGRFDILARRDLAATLDRVAEPYPPGPMRAAIDPLYARRRQGVRRWMQAVTAAEAAAAELPADVRDALLLLRAIRNGGDLRAAAWLYKGLDHPAARVRREAAGAMDLVAERFEAARFRWANDLDPAAFRPYVEQFGERARALIDAPPESGERKLAIVVLDVLAAASAREHE